MKKLDESYCNHFCHVLGPDIIRRATGEHQNPMAQRIRTKKEAKRTVMLNRRALKYYSLLYPFLYLNSRREEKKQLHIKKGRKMYYQSAQQNIVPFGACLIFTPKFVTTEEVAFWPETKFYYEEYLLTYRCKKKGYIIIYDPELKVIHESGMATKRILKMKKKDCDLRWRE